MNNNDDFFSMFLNGIVEGIEFSVQSLLRQHLFSVNDSDMQGKTGLHWACYYGRLNLVEMLINQKDIDINAFDNEKTTALHSAVYSTHNNIHKLDIIKILLQNGAQVNAEDHLGQTPLCYAQSDEVAKLLIENNADTDRYVYNRFPRVHIRDRFSYVIKCLDIQHNETLFNEAEEALKQANYLTYKKPTTCTDWESIILTNDLGLAVATICVAPELVNEFFLVLGVWHTPLSFAAFNNQLDMMSLLICQHALVDVVDLQGNTILMRMVCELFNSLKTARLLINHSANLNYANNLGDTLIHLTLKHDMMDLFHLFVDSGAALPEQSLQLAIASGNLDTVAYILDNPPIDCNDADGSVLTEAVELGLYEMVKLLLEKGVERQRISISTHDSELVSLLLSYECCLFINPNSIWEVALETFNLVVKASENVDGIFGTDYALEHVIENNRMEMVPVLVKCGATCTVESFILAMQHELEEEMIDLILEHAEYSTEELVTILHLTEDRGYKSKIGLKMYGQMAVEQKDIAHTSVVEVDIASTNTTLSWSDIEEDFK